MFEELGGRHRVGLDQEKVRLRVILMAQLRSHFVGPPCFSGTTWPVLMAGLTGYGKLDFRGVSVLK